MVGIRARVRESEINPTRFSLLAKVDLIAQFVTLNRLRVITAVTVKSPVSMHCSTLCGSAVFYYVVI